MFGCEAGEGVGRQAGDLLAVSSDETNDFLNREVARGAQLAELFDDLQAFCAWADESDVVGDGEDADMFFLELCFAQYRVEAEAEELHAQGVSLGAARLSEDDLSGSVVPVVEQLCHVVVPSNF